MFVTKLRRKYERMSMTRHLSDEHEYLDHRVDVHAPVGMAVCRTMLTVIRDA